ncbi:MAG: GlcNAc-PI de-N-acetylase [Glaciihabitans sp.]|nr:GlcNAc-PI de-N-acetylase [Glaciihabitans sp.]MDQ1571591.1 mycothiol S-conjugate amidase [Actinomycetota bacterium]
MTLRLLAVHAHPDDESSKGAGTSASYRARGARVMVVSCTGGERGSILNEKVEARAAAERDIAGLRRLEMARAREIMDIEHRWLGYQDSGMPDEGEALPHGSFASIPLEISAEPLVRIIREYRPQVMVTYDENGGYPHPDHIRTHEVSVYARDAAADPTRYPTAGAAWQIDKLYYERIFNGPRMNALYAALVETDPDNPIIAELADMRRWFERPDLATSHVPIGDFLELRDEALRSHASQVAPDSSFFFWPNELQRSTWPYEDYQLVDSRVHTELPEDDLFTGIATEETA